MRVSYDNWFCCAVDNDHQVELCKIKRNKAGNYSVMTYYDGREVYSGSMEQCRKWIDTHWIEKRYLEHYGRN